MQETDRLLGALRARVAAFRDGDPSKVLDQEAIAEAAQLSREAQSASLSGQQLTPVIQALAYLHWSRYLLLPSDAATADFVRARALFAFLSRLDQELVPEPIRRRLAGDASAGHGHDALTILKRAIAGDDAADLDHAIGLLRQVIAATPEDDPRRSGHLSNLGVALTTRFDRSGQLADIDEAISLQSQTVKAASDRGAASWQDLTNLGLAFRSKHERAGVISDLNEAVRYLHKAAEAVQPGDPMRAGLLQNLVISLLTRYQNHPMPLISKKLSVLAGKRSQPALTMTPIAGTASSTSGTRLSSGLTGMANCRPRRSRQSPPEAADATPPEELTERRSSATCFTCYRNDSSVSGNGRPRRKDPRCHHDLGSHSSG